MNPKKTLVIGASGQVGTELVTALRKKYGNDQVVASDIRTPENSSLTTDGPWEIVNVLNDEQIRDVIARHGITDVYHLAAMLSAVGEKNPGKAWDLNMNGLSNILDIAKEGKIECLFWPSSIAIFGPTTPKDNTPQSTICEPTTVYGISKLAGERWCEYYHDNFGVDVRSLRYPGLIGHKSEPGGGTTDYAVDIFFKAVFEGEYTSFISSDNRLPMMYMDDAIRATIELMEAPRETIKIRSSYNVSGMDFTPSELAEAIQRKMPEFIMKYAPDFRDQIATSWPNSINDDAARQDWEWKPACDVDGLVDTMMTAIRKKKDEGVTI